MKGKKLLAGILSAAMVLGTMAFPVFADDTMTYGEFLKKIQDSGNVCDFGGATIKITTDMFCTDTNHTDCGYVDYRSNNIGAPKRIQGTNAQYQLLDNAVDVTIKNAKFVTDKSKGVGLHLTNNNGWQGEIAKGENFNVELQFKNSGNLTIEDCEFDGLNVAPYHNGGSTKKGTVDSFKNNKFSNVYNAYGIQGAYAEKVIVDNNSFDNCNGGMYLEGAKKDVTISNNTFDNMGENAVEEKKQTAGCIQISAGVSSDANIAIVNNASDGSTPVLRQLSNVSTITTANNNFGGSSELTKTTNSNDVAQNEVSAVAKNGDAYYETLKDAVAAVQTGETIEMLADATGDGIVVPSGSEFTIDFGGYTYTVDGETIGSTGSKTNGFQLLKNSNITFKNGKITSNKAAILIQNYSNLTLEDITLELTTTSETTTGTDDKTRSYVLSNNNGDTVIKGNTNIIAGKTPQAYAFDIYGGWYPAYPSVTVTVDKTMTGTIVGDIQIANGKVAKPEDFKLTIKNGTFVGNIVDQRNASQKNAYPKFEAVSGGSFTTDVSAYCADGFAAKKIGDVWVVDESASKVSLGFKATDDARVYDIVVKAEDAEKINRLNTADLTFNLTASDAANSSVVYTILPVDNITVTPDIENVNRYMFNFNGKDGITADTGAEVKIGQVQFDGYTTNGATIEFTADADKSLVTATTKSNNLVTYFGTGAFANATAADRKIDGVKFAVPTKKLTINVAMNNKVTDNVKAYQDMKVEIKGANTAKTIDLGKGGVVQENGVYTVTADLEQNIPYTVTVSGAGYRTARYTVNLNADKTLNFWNNVMDNAIEVEEGNTAYKKNVTFLAGDIVKDNKINIYDLSAVVSYFGTKTDKTATSEYAKYDLNRDGVIDSKDVAYVLVSWGN